MRHASLSLLAFALCMFVGFHAPTTKQSPAARPVRQFTAHDVSLFDAILLLGQEQHIPLGIEYIDADALQRQITAKTGATTVGRVLDLILKHQPGYSWTVQDGVICITHSGVPAGTANLLNRMLPEFSIQRESVTEAGITLDRTLERSLHPDSQGSAGSYAGDISPIQVGPFSMRNVTVRQALDRIVGQATDAAWVVQAAPGKLDKLPSYGLWKIVQYENPPKAYSPMFLGILRYVDSNQPNSRARPMRH